MKKFTKEDILKVAHEIHFVVREDVLIELERFFNEQLAHITTLVNAIDTSNIAPMTHVDASPRTLLREDVPGHAEIPYAVIVKNAHKTELHHISIPQAVKDD